ncbi:MAG: hypothetical protein GX559_02750 [Candidatus Pacebacteria bacterium]|nr:hypothetical protein [Candidatus Paceibacterota bacterium]
MTKKFKFFFFFLSIVASALILYAGFRLWQNNLKSPIGDNFSFKNVTDWFKFKTNHQQKIVYGFLPYWNLNKIKVQDELTHLSYFALEVGADGQIVTHSRPGETEPGYRQLNSDEFLNLLDNNQFKNELVLSQFDASTIKQFLDNQRAWITLIEQIDSLLLAYPFTGINLDFEYPGEVSDQLRQQFVNLVISIHQHLAARQEKINLSIDVYASAGNQNKKLLWDIKQLEPHLDYLIVMAYDFHRQNSTQAGPGAPLLGGQELWTSDINTLMKGFFEQVPREKILLGLPFYGYGWQTDSIDPRANTYPGTGFTVSYQEALALKSLSGRWENCRNLNLYWQEEALSPFATLNCPKENPGGNDKTENEEEAELLNYLVYFENAQSLQYKIDYAKQLDLAGIAIWALGYEGESRDLWEVVKSLNN